jgi:transcription antitermination factor NusG
MLSYPDKKKWYAVYIRSRAEKKVFIELENQHIENYLPLQKKIRQWSDRKKWIEAPLIPGYIFVKITKHDYEKVLKIPNVVSYVRFEGKAAIIPEYQIDTIKRLLRQHDIDIEISYTNIEKGDPVEVMAGPLMGTKGKLVLFKGKKRVAIELAQMNLSLTIEVPLHEIRKVT